MESATPHHLPAISLLPPNAAKSPLSGHPAIKYIAMSIFVLLPFIGFFLGIQYQLNLEYSSVYGRTKEGQIIYRTQKECEVQTSSECEPINCDLVNENETHAQTCGKHFKKGWVRTGQSQQPVPTQKIEHLKTYFNSALNYSFQYPPTVEIYQTDLSGISDVTTAANPTDLAIYIQTISDSSNESTALLEISKSSQPTFSETNWKIENIQINQVKFAKYTNKYDTNTKTIYVTPIKNSNEYLWIYSNSQTDKQGIVSQILDTFRFTQPVNDSNITSDQECKQYGGEWARWGDTDKESCQIPLSDANKRCTDGSQCLSGRCIAQNNKLPGACSEYKRMYGCIDFVKNNQIEPTLCID